MLWGTMSKALRKSRWMTSSCLLMQSLHHRKTDHYAALGEAMLAVSNHLPDPTCLSIAARRICSMIFAGTEVRPTGQ